jgi:hypothetical protein
MPYHFPLEVRVMCSDFVPEVKIISSDSVPAAMISPPSIIISIRFASIPPS